MSLSGYESPDCVLCKPHKLLKIYQVNLPEFLFKLLIRIGGTDMETINNPKLRERYLRERQILQHFSTCTPDFLLLHYTPGELLTNPFSPSRYLQFVVDGELLLYDMPNEESTVMIKASFHDVGFLGEMELLDAGFIPFFVEARTEVYTLAIHLERYQQTLLNDPVFLRYVCLSLAAKLADATAATAIQPMPLRDRVIRALRRIDKGDSFSDIGRHAKVLNVSTRQLLRVLKELCEEGVLEHEKKGVYRVLKKTQA